MRVEHRFIEVDDLRLHALDFGGDGPPVVCLHGVTGHAWMWHGVAAALRGRRRLLAVDLRGHGDSQWSQREAYETDDHVGDLRSAFGTSPEPLDVVGLSWGGLIGLRLAARAPQVVRRLAVIDSPPSSPLRTADVPDQPYEFDGHAAAVAWERQANPRAAAPTVDALALYGTRPGGGGKLVRKHDPYFSWRWPFRADDHWDDLGSLDLPTFLVRGEESPVLSVDVFAQMGSALPSARSEVVPQAGHLVPVDNPVGLAEALDIFLR